MGLRDWESDRDWAPEPPPGGGWAPRTGSRQAPGSVNITPRGCSGAGPEALGAGLPGTGSLTSLALSSIEVPETKRTRGSLVGAAGLPSAVGSLLSHRKQRQSACGPEAGAREAGHLGPQSCAAWAQQARRRDGTSKGLGAPEALQPPELALPWEETRETMSSFGTGRPPGGWLRAERTFHMRTLGPEPRISAAGPASPPPSRLFQDRLGESLVSNACKARAELRRPSAAGVTPGSRKFCAYMETSETTHPASPRTICFKLAGSPQASAPGPAHTSNSYWRPAGTRFSWNLFLERAGE